MKPMSRAVVFVDTNAKKDRISVLKDSATIQELDDSDSNVFCKSLLDRYEHRPLELQNMCLAEFAANYSTDYKTSDDVISQSDVLPSVSDSDCAKPCKITLTDGFGKMNKRRHEAVIRFRKFNREKEPSNWFRAKLMLYFPWYSEEADLLGGCSSYEEHYRRVHTIVSANEKKYTQSDIDMFGIKSPLVLKLAEPNMKQKAQKLLLNCLSRMLGTIQTCLHPLPQVVYMFAMKVLLGMVRFHLMSIKNF